MRTQQTARFRVHLGCGTHIVSGWVNVDGSWNARLAQYPRLRSIVGSLGLIPRNQRDLEWKGNLICHNLCRNLPFEAGSVSCIYAAHVLEHLYRNDAFKLLKECHRVLDANGILRMVVPDLHATVLRYLTRRENAGSVEGRQPSPADELNVELGFRRQARPTGSMAYRVYTALTDFHSHKWMYDAESLCGLFREAGFAEVGERQVFDSRITEIEAIEQASRVENGQGICVEGVKEARASAPRPQVAMAADLMGMTREG
jgi:predicted SAM-dependent methyltransferase